LLVFAAHSLSPIATSSDSRWTVPLILSLLSQGNTDLDEFASDMRAHGYRGIQCVDAGHRVISPSSETGCPAGSHAYYTYPIGTSVLAAPVMIAMDACIRVLGPVAAGLAGARLTPVERQFAGREYSKCYALVELVLASFIIALAAVAMFLTARLFLPAAGAALLAFLFAFATPAYSTASRALWQHGPNMLMLAAALYLFSRAGSRASFLKWTAVPLVFACFIRPTSIIFVVLTGAFVWVHHRGQFRKWLLLAACTAVPFLAHNVLVYRWPLPPYFMAQRFMEISPRSFGPLMSALAGQCVSPSRGLFTFSPFLLFSLAGMCLACRRSWQTPLVYYLAAGVALHWFAISAFADWTGGYSFGPRYFSDIVPILIFFLVPVFQLPRKPMLLAAVFLLCALASLFVHFRGATTWDVYLWNGDAGGVTPARAWDWRDPQFLRGLF